MYDVLYTKVLVVHSLLGIFLRSIGFFSIVSTLISYSLSIKMDSQVMT